MQGPAARDVLQTLTGVDLADIKYYWFTTGEVAGVARARFRAPATPAKTASRSSCRRRRPSGSGTRSSQPGRSAGLVPPASAPRDTLRLEAAMRLYGNDMDETTTVLEADLGWIVGWKKDDFIGADVLRRQKAEGVYAQAGRLRGPRPRHRPSGLPGVRRRAARPASSPAAPRRRS